MRLTVALKLPRESGFLGIKPLWRIKIEYDSNHIPQKTEYYYVPLGVMDMGEYWLYKIENYKNND